MTTSVNNSQAPTDKLAPSHASEYDSATNNIVVAALYKFTRFAEF